MAGIEQCGQQPPDSRPDGTGILDAFCGCAFVLETPGRGFELPAIDLHQRICFFDGQVESARFGRPVVQEGRARLSGRCKFARGRLRSGVPSCGG